MIYRKSIKQCNNWFFLKRNKNKGLIAMGSRTLVDITLHTLYWISFHVPLFTLKYFLSCPSGEQSRVKNQMWKKKKKYRDTNEVKQGARLEVEGVEGEISCWSNLHAVRGFWKLNNWKELFTKVFRSLRETWANLLLGLEELKCRNSYTSSEKYIFNIHNEMYSAFNLVWGNIYNFKIKQNLWPFMNIR